ncbi:trypsin domain-containing protein [Phthorimaea operculella]|nr:trypsin domain-containing protein [Phthorimaea operculella]
MHQWSLVTIILVIFVLHTLCAREFNATDFAPVDNHVRVPATGNRSQRFLFDAIFGLEVPVLDEPSVEDEDDEDSGVNKCSSQRFLFDAIFGLEVPVLDEPSVEDEDDEDSGVNKCSCGVGNRSQRFLFDAIFGLEVPVLDEPSVEDEDDEDSGVNKCSCGGMLVVYIRYLRSSMTICQQLRPVMVNNFFYEDMTVSLIVLMGCWWSSSDPRGLTKSGPCPSLYPNASRCRLTPRDVALQQDAARGVALRRATSSDATRHFCSNAEHKAALRRSLQLVVARRRATPREAAFSLACGRVNPLPRKLECGGANQENRIVGGMPAGTNRYPWMARIVYDGQFHCGASVLTKEYVLTAAHCVRKLKRTKIRVILGDHDQTITTESAAIMRAVTSIVRHRSFDADSYNNDIALLKLRKPITFNKIIKPVCLPPANLEPAGKQGIVVGWGRTSEGGQLPAIVQEVKVPILSLSQCRGMKYRASRITNNMLCAGRASTDSCQGDSGGPLLVQDGDKFQIVGIVSWGVGCGRPGYPGVYTRITRYLPWLRANLRDTCLCAD